jgi:hypothetical protein
MAPVLLLDFDLQDHSIDVDHPTKHNSQTPPEPAYLFKGRRSRQDPNSNEALNDVEIGLEVRHVALLSYVFIDN